LLGVENRHQEAGGLPLNVEELTALLGGWEGYVLGTVGRVEPVGEQGRFKPEIWLELRLFRFQV
jgi:hypothetical protein